MRFPYSSRFAGTVLQGSALAATTAAPTFHPDSTFQGSTLKGWHSKGDANWSAKAGEIIGKANGAASGWLMLGQSYQDVAMNSVFKCP